jgi:hypothetical protein
MLGISLCALVAIPVGAAMWVSWRTPTDGFGCRAVTKLCFLLFWLASFVADLFLWWICKKIFREDGCVTKSNPASAHPILRYFLQGLLYHCWRHCYTHIYRHWCFQQLLMLV